MKVDSNDVWKQIKDETSLFSYIMLKIGGDTISICLSRLNDTQLVYSVYVNGLQQGIDFKKESVIGQKYYRPHVVMNPSRKLYNAMVEAIGKRASKKYLPKKEVIGYIPFFKSFRSLKSVLSKHENIEWLNPPK